MYNSNVDTVALIEEFNTVFTGSIDDKVFQYDLHTGKILKVYKHLGLCGISACVYFKNILFFGGNNFYIKAIDIYRRKICNIEIKTAVK